MGSVPSFAEKSDFNAGLDAARTGQFLAAAKSFRAALAEQPAAGTLVNLGLAEWRAGRTGDAIFFWEQAAWLDPFEKNARNNLLFARQAAQLESPELNWCETGSTWLPASAWAWIACVSLWLAVALMILPGVMRWRKVGWPPAAAAAALVVFILSLPPNLGVITRANLGIVLEKNAALRLTPTKDGELVAALGAGEPVRKLRDRGNYFFIRTSHGNGWIERNQLGLVTPK